MTNDELANKIAGLPFYRIVWKIALMIVILFSLFFLNEVYHSIKKEELLAQKIQGEISNIIASPVKVETGSIKVHVELELKKWISDLKFRPFNWVIIIILYIPLFVFISRNSRKRRSIFLKNFQEAHLKNAPRCSITRVRMFPALFRKLQNVSLWSGTIFEVLKEKEIFVIFNEPFSLSERLFSKYDGYRAGVLLNYEGHYFFYCSSWIPNFDFGDD